MSLGVAPSPPWAWFISRLRSSCAATVILFVGMLVGSVFSLFSWSFVEVAMSVPRFQLVVFAAVLAASLVSYVLFVSVFSSISLVSPVLAKGKDLARVEDFSGVSLFFFVFWCGLCLL